MTRALSLAAAFSVLGLFSVVACSGQSSDDGITGDDQEVRSAGTMCGGIAGLRCAPGLTCKYDSGGPPPGAVGLPAPTTDGGGPPPGAVGLPHPDQSGTCVAPKLGEEGATCGGIAALKCNPGLVCKYGSASSSSSGGPPPGAVGLPRPQPDAGSSSGGPPPGAVGLPYPDQSGTCQKSSGPPPGAVGLPHP